MWVEQYVYFALRSERLSAVEIAREIGMEPDEVTLRGSRLPEIPIPRAHAWRVVCRDAELFLNQQIDQVLDRLEPYAGRIGELVARSTDAEERSITACLEIVRWYTPEVAGGEVPDRNFLGWVLDERALAFLTLTGAVVDVDEYGS